MVQRNLYAYGYVDDPVKYAIKALKKAELLIGQSKMIEFAIIALNEYEEVAARLDWMLSVLMDALEQHRAEHIIACDESCWCWDAETIIAEIERFTDG